MYTVEKENIKAKNEFIMLKKCIVPTHTYNYT